MSDAEGMRRRLEEATAGDYEVIRELGRGGMATVFLARDLALDRQVAIKVMSPQLLAVEGMAERFLQEARVSAALQHPHIVPIHAVRRSGDLLYFVMKFVAGRSLDAILAAHGPLRPAVVRALLTQVGAALEAAHARGVVHRDIKPANILVDERGDAVVADFGIARLVEQPGRTQVGETVGTPAYMSPEQCSGDTLTGAADQYSLGVVAYELLTGAPPFTGDGLMQVVWKMVHEELVPLTTHRSDVEPALAAAVHRMLATRAAERWPSVAAAVAALPALVLRGDAPERLELIRMAQGEVVPGASAPTERSGPVTASLRLSQVSGVMTVDDEVELRAEALDGAGARLEGAVLGWSSSDPTVARVGADGRLTAVGIGRATVTAFDGDAEVSLALTVTRAGLRALTLAPAPSTLEVGDRVPLRVLDGSGGASAPSARLVAWGTSDPAVARVDAAGMVTAVGEGRVEIVARAGGASRAVEFRVKRAMISAVAVSSPAPRIRVGERIRLAAAPANTRGHPLSGLPVRWEVSDPAIAAISPEGELTALRSGQVLVAARVSGRVGTARVTVASPV